MLHINNFLSLPQIYFEIFDFSKFFLVWHNFLYLVKSKNKKNGAQKACLMLRGDIVALRHGAMWHRLRILWIVIIHSKKLVFTYSLRSMWHHYSG